VRELESRARAANETATPRKPAAPSRVAPHPDQLDACATIGEVLQAAFGSEVRVVVARGGGYRAELTFQSPEEALELADRVKRKK
jgi:hypothetical protein